MWPTDLKHTKTGYDLLQDFAKDLTANDLPLTGSCLPIVREGSFEVYFEIKHNEKDFSEVVLKIEHGLHQWPCTLQCISEGFKGSCTEPITCMNEEELKARLLEITYSEPMKRILSNLCKVAEDFK